MVELKRKKGETFESFFRRFTRQLQRSGRLYQAKKVRFFERTKSRTQQREAALRRNEIRGKHEYLRRTGKLPEESLTGNRRSSR
jgi:ribosomal protein S21